MRSNSDTRQVPLSGQVVENAKNEGDIFVYFQIHNNGLQNETLFLFLTTVYVLKLRLRHPFLENVRKCDAAFALISDTSV